MFISTLTHENPVSQHQVLYKFLPTSLKHISFNVQQKTDFSRIFQIDPLPKYTFFTEYF